ncbi:transketolase [Enterococcus sp. AZ170]|uniref:transketolase n=1 Tax=Enterococcus sp. AZ170 TaxID=2774747 RepID=UPI003D301197
MEKLEKKAQELRRMIIESLAAAGSGHPGGSLSAIDILTTLYYQEMTINTQNYEQRDRDHFILSKGHGAPALYAILADKGFFPKSDLMTLRKFGSHLQGHPDKNKTYGVDASSGSLGQGLSIANGLALAKRSNDSDCFTFVLLGDGELQEGQVWEAAMSAAHYHLNRLIVLIDHNGLQIDGTNEAIMGVNDIGAKFASFNWHVQQVNGHTISAIAQAIQMAKKETEAPSVIVCETIKGKGISFMENQVGWHGKAPSHEEAALALAELMGAE